MAKRIQLRRGTTAQHSSFIGAIGELTMDTDKKILKLHDGTTVGGVNPVEVDATPTDGSNNPVSSNGVFDSLAGKVSKTGDTMTGNLVFASGTKIQGDFNNTTVSSRTAFQNSNLNANTNITVIPNGTSVVSTFDCYNNSNPTNASKCLVGINASTLTIQSGISGTGTYLPIIMQTGGAERLRIDTSGNVLVIGSGGLGYGTGSGGTVTQLTSKTTAVTLNKPSGQITMHNASLAGGAEAIFTVTNSLVTMSDTIIIHQADPSIPLDRYEVRCVSAGAGVFVIAVKNRTGTSYSDALPINFAVIKGVTS